MACLTTFKSENPNKTLEGIKTMLYRDKAQWPFAGENPNKTLEGIKTLIQFLIGCGCIAA
ncbi:hypothetical protein U27_01440 [Candidatus Vecturithrix granuli]|uniref:Uncharacterized protein n=1 Tax=Vecturithrix granuli TaxID=1499967 RepID=A0A081CAD4_VECG1|nr:hypothetical protein U27_01440 [Candidatus Vecturithrix granuli]